MAEEPKEPTDYEVMIAHLFQVEASTTRNRRMPTLRNKWTEDRELREIRDFLSKPKEPTFNACSVCGSARWSTQRLAGSMVYQDGSVLVGEVAPLMQLVCQVCFHSISFAWKPIWEKRNEPSFQPYRAKAQSIIAAQNSALKVKKEVADASPAQNDEGDK